jgi:hypothetical protein
VKEPVDGKKYAQGDVRIIVAAKNGKLSTVIVTIDHESLQDTVTLNADATGTTFYGFARCEQIGSYTLTFAVTFNDEAQTQKSATRTIEIAAAAEDTANPEGQDLTAFLAAIDQFRQAYQDIMKAAAEAEPVQKGIIDRVSTAAKSVVNAGKSAAGRQADNLTGIITDLSNTVKELVP